MYKHYTSVQDVRLLDWGNRVAVFLPNPANPTTPFRRVINLSRSPTSVRQQITGIDTTPNPANLPSKPANTGKNTAVASDIPTRANVASTS